MKPWIEASGVRISWLALATKSERIRSIITCSVCSRNAISTPWPPSPRSTGSIRALNCLARSWVGLKVTLLAVVPASAPVTAASTPGSRSTRASGTGGSGAVEAAPGGRVGLDARSVSRSTTRIGSGSASMIERSIRCCAAIRPDCAAQLPAQLGHRPQQPAGRTCLSLSSRRGRSWLARQALDPGGDASRARADGARARKAPTDEADQPSQHGAHDADLPEGGKPGQRQAGRRAPDQALAQKRTIAAIAPALARRRPPSRDRRPSCPSWPSAGAPLHRCSGLGLDLVERDAGRELDRLEGWCRSCA